MESLLVQGQQAEGSTETIAIEVPGQIADDRACSMVGRHIGAYEVVSRVGAGEIGEVYQARDTRLKRTVAIRILPRDKISDPERRRRFVQEARTASALNHLNIITIHDIGREDGVDVVVMEYVAGKTLEQHLIPRHGLKLKKLTEVLQTSIQMADALAKAHSAGIIHRNLKPGNVMLTGDGLVKVLDFSLARLTER